MSDNPLKLDAKRRIHAAARSVFLKEGFSGARMQTIADAASLNKALLHYYYRDKETLYKAVFDEAYAEFLWALEKLNDPGLNLVQKLEQFVAEVQMLAAASPQVVAFILSEVARQEPAQPPHPAQSRFALHSLHISRQIVEGGNLGLIKRADPLAVLMQLFSLSLFPLLSAGLFTQLLALPEVDLAERLKAYYAGIPKLVMSSLGL